jgi:hydrogenase maturation protein HypF
MLRRAIDVSGIVQGVGFRPFVYDLATGLGLNGFVRNQTGGVLIEVEGEAHSLDRFLTELRSKAPPLARIDEVSWESCFPRGDPQFRIESSKHESAGSIFISPDVATCEDCLRELFDPQDRRFRYPFLNCTNCGPRFTIIRDSPYDRVRTTMATFAMCPACQAEYDDPHNRRFHAQPTACTSCGPRLRVLDTTGEEVEVEDPLAHAVAALRSEKIVALKGIGGYHLACRADSAPAVAELRRRKHRDEKPLAVMVADPRAANELCEIGPREHALLVSLRRPIVLLRRRSGAPVADQVAPGNPFLGVFLPYSPLHHLLLRDIGMPLVMTSGNRSDEPIAYEDPDARDRLSGIADVILTHDRPIHLRCDDSVTQCVAGAELPFRRSRGYAPEPLPLPVSCHRPILAAGGQLKSTFALGRGRHAFLSHHLGDLDYYEAYRAYVDAIEHYQRLFAMRPDLIVHDLHPDYASTRWARQHEGSIPLLGVQHHEAHIASCMADNGLDERLIGVAFDGTGYGTDGAVWGGEFFTGDYRGFVRAAHLRYVAMPGGEQAVREPWRMAVAFLADAEQGGDELLGGRVPAKSIASVRLLINRRLNAPMTSSVGRLFDGVASLAGVRDRISYEGQAAMELEWLASPIATEGIYPFEILETSPQGSPLQIDTRPLFVALAAERRLGQDQAVMARRFHSTLAEMVSQVCSRLRERTGLDVVALSGGVFLNALLTKDVTARLENQGFRVYRHHRVPPGDGGLSLGQIAIAAARDLHA